VETVVQNDFDNTAESGSFRRFLAAGDNIHADL
jgi:hypothetical protein